MQFRTTLGVVSVVLTVAQAYNTYKTYTEGGGLVTLIPAGMSAFWGYSSYRVLSGSKL